jgi:hypothetical protein
VRFEGLGEVRWTHVFGRDIAPGELGAERGDYREVVLVDRLSEAVHRRNLAVPQLAVHDVEVTVTRTELPVIETEIWTAYRYLSEGVPIEYHDADGALRFRQVNERVRAKIRTRFGGPLLKHGYPPDKEFSATELIIAQVKQMAAAGAA